MTRCPCCERDGRSREIAVMLTRWAGGGTQTTLRCPWCGCQDAREDDAVTAAVERGA